MKNSHQYAASVSEDQFEQIERFFLNKMQQSEREAFEERLRRDEKLKEEFSLYQKMRASLEVRCFLAEREKAKDIVATAHVAPVKKISSGRGKWLAAASILAVLVAGIWLLLSPSPSEKLYAKYYSVDPGLPTNMGDEEEYEFFRGMVDYKMADFEKAILRWEKLYATQSEDNQLAYFLGMAWLNLGNTEQAMPFLEKVSVDNNNSFQQSSIWYLALVNIKNGNYTAASQLLAKIPNYPNARELHTELRK